MGDTAALEALLKAYREEIAWLLARAKEHEGQDAVQYVHRARNLQAVIDGYERLAAKGS